MNSEKEKHDKNRPAKTLDIIVPPLAWDLGSKKGDMGRGPGHDKWL
jgi:hypothetical protein